MKRMTKALIALLVAAVIVAGVLLMKKDKKTVIGTFRSSTTRPWTRPGKAF